MSEPLTFEMVFKHDPSGSYPWNALSAAEKWLRVRGLSVGAMQSGSPSAVFEGDCLVSKWRDLTEWDRTVMAGTVTAVGDGRFRECDVVVRLKKEPVELVG